MCDEEKETTIHQFLNCPYARAIQHGSILGLRTSELQCNSTKQWLSQCIISSKVLEHNKMNYLQALFTTFGQFGTIGIWFCIKDRFLTLLKLFSYLNFLLAGIRKLSIKAKCRKSD